VSWLYSGRVWLQAGVATNGSSSLQVQQLYSGKQAFRRYRAAGANGSARQAFRRYSHRRGWLQTGVATNGSSSLLVQRLYSGKQAFRRYRAAGANVQCKAGVQTLLAWVGSLSCTGFQIMQTSPCIVGSPVSSKVCNVFGSYVVQVTN
jgi:hypothetical protein